jgi:anti-anti-sigma factor
MDFQTAPIVIKPIADGVRVALSGPIHTNTAWIERELDKVVAQKPRLVELDLSGTEHISSLGLGILVKLHNGLKAGGGTMRIVKILPKIKGILRAAYLDRMLVIAPDAVIEAEGKTS